ncbi:MAG: protease modulator HflK [Armatimonadetes bacterium]|nr:protease modulator HflK [Armatimonadota bacterium]
MKRLFRGWSWEHWYNLAREDIEAAFDSVRRAAVYAAVVAVGLWLFSGVHVIRQNEVGLPILCGRLLSRTEGPGLHIRFPWPIEAVRRVPMQTQQRVTVGLAKGGLTANERMGLFEKRAIDTNVGRQFDKTDETQKSVLEETIKAGQEGTTGEKAKDPLGTGLPLLTADHNLVMVTAVVQYIINKPDEFVYGSEDTPLLILRTATNALLQEAARTGVDDLLTVARTAVQGEVKSASQAGLTARRVGVEIVGVELQRLNAPETVKAAFDGVQSALQERTTRVTEAQQYLGQTIPLAESDAGKIVKDVLSQFRQNPGVTGERLRLETLEKCFAAANKVQVGGTAQNPVDVNLWQPQPGTEP